MSVEVHVRNILEVRNATEEIKKWCADQLVLDNPEYITKVRMGFYVGNTPKKIWLYEADGDTLYIPYGCLRQILSFDPDCKIINELTPQPKVDYHIDPHLYEILYDYQTSAMNALIENYYGMLVAPAGSGKTTIGIALAGKLGKKTLWIAHTIDLVNQAKKEALKWMPEDGIGEISGGKVNIGKCITFATIQTLDRLDMNKYRDVWDCVIVDECHRVSGSPTRATMFYKCVNTLNARHKFGLTATDHRADGMMRCAYTLLGKVCYTVSDEMVSSRILKVNICPIPTETKESLCYLRPDGMIDGTKFQSYLASDTARNKLIANFIKENRDHSCLILSMRLKQLKEILELLPADMRKQAVSLHSEMKSSKLKKVREQGLEDMRTGKKKYLFATYALAKEGLNIPILDRLFLANPQTDYSVVTQSIGRIARTHANKGEPIVYDFVDNFPKAFRMYKERCKTYRKCKCRFITVEQAEAVNNGKILEDDNDKR